MVHTLTEDFSGFSFTRLDGNTRTDHPPISHSVVIASRFFVNRSQQIGTLQAIEK